MSVGVHSEKGQFTATVFDVEADDLRTRDDLASAGGERLIAARLDALEAERVMQRALELEAESLDEPHVITTKQLESIAHEIGVDPAFLHRALGEVRLAPGERSRFDRWVIPQDLIETATIKGLTRNETNSLINKWMTEYEGMIKGGILADGAEWHVDRGWRARLTSRALSGGNQISRLAGSDVVHRVQTLTEREHVVALQSEGRQPLNFAKTVIAVGIALGVQGFLAAALSGAFLTGVVAFAVLSATGTAIAVSGARRKARALGEILRQSLVGLVGATKPHPTRKGWFERKRPRKKKKKS